MYCNRQHALLNNCLVSKLITITDLRLTQYFATSSYFAMFTCSVKYNSYTRHMNGENYVCEILPIKNFFFIQLKQPQVFILFNHTTIRTCTCASHQLEPKKDHDNVVPKCFGPAVRSIFNLPAGSECKVLSIPNLPQ